MSVPKSNKLQPLIHKLVLNKWLISLFGTKDFRELASPLTDVKLEGLDESGVHYFHHVLVSHFPHLDDLSPDLLLYYDQNIARHTQRINEERIKRGISPVTWKYFQYIGLLFSEIYLDRYFDDPGALLEEINLHIDCCNEVLNDKDRISSFTVNTSATSQLNKLSFWMATGSGKTLLMHINMLQYIYYLDKHDRRRELNRIILLTPNEGLSKQHLAEFQQSGIRATLFTREALSLSLRESVQIIEITRLRDEMGDRTIAVDAFEGNNLVLVDEGHRGASSGKDGSWMRFRAAVCEQGFSFEYSATFAQAITGNPQLVDLYAKNILFDYSYRHFYSDGFGKDYQIFNIDNHLQDSGSELYLVACLLSFYQQMRLYSIETDFARSYNIDQPLCVFVGGRVVKGWSKVDGSDIIELLQFLDSFVSNKGNSVRLIDQVLLSGITTSEGVNLFDGAFPYLIESSLSSEQIFDEILELVFNAKNGGHLYIDKILGSDGEIALHLGAQNNPFGVINVGDTGQLTKLCQERDFNVRERMFTSSLFHQINERGSSINLLIGSRKFTEGWSSWRVSTMGLMNIGKREGAQIIQLFGRGVRLKGFDSSLKRSSAGLPDGVQSPRYIGILETLGIFGIRANYMAQFKQFLAAEGLSTDNGKIEFILPVVRNIQTDRLKMLRLKDSVRRVQTDETDSFQKFGPALNIDANSLRVKSLLPHLVRSPIIVNWYPRIHAIRSEEISQNTGTFAPHEAQLHEGHLAYLDFYSLYMELERYKTERRWFNLNLTISGIESMMAISDWYRIQIPKSDLLADRYEKVRIWQDIALTVLKKLLNRCYDLSKREWETPHLEYQLLRKDDANFINEYRVSFETSQSDIRSKLYELRNLLQDHILEPWQYRGIHAVQFSQHLYQPLLYFKQDFANISPIPLNEGERKFVDDLACFYSTHPKFFKFRELYILRNQSRGKGIGFFEAGNFYPDFIVWVVEGGKQRIIFVDPKGIRHLGWNDPKIMFHQSIKKLETRLSDSNVQLDSYIVSNTSSSEMQRLWGVNKDEIEARHILFQNEDEDTYVGKILNV